MRLIHTTTLELSEFFDSDVPEYAILSHCWGDDEVSLQVFQEGKKKEGSGYAKIIDCCRVAREHGLKWAWVDTCCIDKSSSAELSEAINSMFRWYENAKVCFVFLSDFTMGRTGSALSGCRWFTKGFTLQELLAPPEVVFFDFGLNEVGTRSSLVHEVSTFTGISSIYLLNNGLLHEASIAQRMSWASKRQTSRSEDIAYCLLGLFDVSMPLLYGEGKERAFLRLQQQIIAQSTDESIFAWRSNSPDERRGMFAKCPSEFARSANIRRSLYVAKRPLYHSTSKGLEFSIPTPFLLEWLRAFYPIAFRFHTVQLECEQYETDMWGDECGRTVHIRLERTEDEKTSWHRVNADSLLQGQYDAHSTINIFIRSWTQIYISEPQGRKASELVPVGSKNWVRLRRRTRSSKAQPLFQLTLWTFSISPTFATFDLLFPEEDYCGNSNIILLWIYLAWCWKLSHYSHWYLAFMISALWFSGNLQGHEMLVAILEKIVIMEIIRISDDIRFNPEVKQM